MSTPWQLQIYEKSFKKKEKVKIIDEYIRDLQNKRCLEIGCDKGVTSFFLRKKGGWWLSTDIDLDNVKITKDLIKSNVLCFKEEAFPFPKASFDYIIAIDTLEHIKDDALFLKNINKILKRDGALCITVPCSKRSLILNRIARRAGMTNEFYGHKREGYVIEALSEKLKGNGFKVLRHDYFSFFFTEAIELAINFLYIFILNKGQKKNGIKGSISPSSGNEFNAHSFSFRIYTIIYPLLQWINQFNRWFPFSTGYCLILEAKKDGES